MSRRGGLAAMAAFAGGVLAGVAAEELVLRRAFRSSDPQAPEVFGAPDADAVWVTSFDGTHIHARVLGPPDAPALVFVHGMTLTHVVWHYQLRHFAHDARFRVVAYDARGHGLSGPVRGPDGKTPFDGETLARDLHAVMHGTRAAPAVIVGHSLGGMTIQSLLEYKDEFPAEFGSTLRGLVLLNTSFTAELGGWAGRARWQRIRGRARRMASWFAEHPGVLRPLRDPASDIAMLFSRLGFGESPSRAHVALTSRLVGSVDLGTLTAATDLAAFDTHRTLSEIDVPVVVCAGDRDLITPLWLSEEMAERIPDAELVVFPGAGHMAMLERHEAFNAVVTRFAERVLRP